MQSLRITPTMCLMDFCFEFSSITAETAEIFIVMSVPTRKCLCLRRHDQFEFVIPVRRCCCDVTQLTEISQNAFPATHIQVFLCLDGDVDHFLTRIY